MGCAPSVLAITGRGRRSSKVTVDSLDMDLGVNHSIKKRYGHPSYYKADGFEVGLRVKV